VQIIEWKTYDSFFQAWLPKWKAEVWDLTDQDDRIGYSTTYGWYTVASTVGLPDLEGSMIAFGLAVGEDGGINTERTGTSYWEY
jgi:hypothetical protein